MPRDVVHRQRRILFVGAPGAFGKDFLPQLSDHDLLDIAVAETGAAGLAMLAASTAQFDAIMIAIHLPDSDGAAICARLRQRGVHTPLLMLAQNAAEFDVVRGLDSGANDFLCAPFRLAELRARLRAQIRAYETSEEAVLRVGPFEFRPASRQLQRHASAPRIRLTEKEAAVLKFLYRADGPVPRNTLLHEVWGYNARATTHTVETHIYRLRRKIEPDPNRIALLVNEDGGYRLAHDLLPAPIPFPRLARTLALAS